MIEFACPECKAKITAKDESGGKKGKCPKCGAAVEVPLTPAPADAARKPASRAAPSPSASGLAVLPIRDISFVDFRHQSILDAPVIETIGRELYALVDEQARKKIVLDFTKVRFLSSQMLGVLINLYKKSKAIRGQVILCGVRPEILKVFTMMKIEKLMTIVETEADAKKTLGFQEGV